LTTIGSTINTIRNSKGFTLKELAETTGLSISYLSRLENDKTEATLNDLSKLAEAFETSIINLFPDKFDQDVRIVRKEETRIILQPSPNGAPSEQEFILWGSKINLEPTIMTVPPGSSSGKTVKHNGEEFLYVLEGEIRVWCDDTCYDLKKGDTIGYPAKHPHRWENIKNETAKVFVVSSLPTF